MKKIKKGDKVIFHDWAKGKDLVGEVIKRYKSKFTRRVELEVKRGPVIYGCYASTVKRVK